MSLGTISPVAIQQFFDANGDPLAGGSLGFFLAGTDTPSPAYADVNLTVPLANPVVLDAAGRAPELFLAALSYKQVLKNAGGVTIWTADNIITPAALRSVQLISSASGSHVDFPVPQGLISFLFFMNTAPLTIDGFSGGTPGQLLMIRALNTAPVHLVPIQTSVATDGNRLYNFVSSGNTTLMPTAGAATYIYQGGSWVLVNHEQGAWIQLPYSASNFATDVGAWTVEAGDVGQIAFYLKGTTLTVTFDIRTSTVAGGPQFLRLLGIPYTFKTSIYALPMLTADATGSMGAGYLPAAIGVQVMTRELVLVRANQVAWPNLTNALYAFGQVDGDVQ